MSLNPPLVLLPMLQLPLACSFGAPSRINAAPGAPCARAQFARAQGDFATVLALGRAGGMAPSISHRLANRARWVLLCRRSSSSDEAKLTETPKLQ